MAEPRAMVGVEEGDFHFEGFVVVVTQDRILPLSRNQSFAVLEALINWTTQSLSANFRCDPRTLLHSLELGPLQVQLEGIS